MNCDERAIFYNNKEIKHFPRATIFVSLPSYRDEECPLTLIDCLQKAKYPERIRIGICEYSIFQDCF